MEALPIVARWTVSYSSTRCLSKAQVRDFQASFIPYVYLGLIAVRHVA